MSSIPCSYTSWLYTLCLLIPAAIAQCPLSIQNPCICTSTRYEAVAIVCDKAVSLGQALRALNNPKRTIDSLIISNTPIEELPAFAFQGLVIKRLIFRNNGMQSIHTDALAGSIAESLEELEIRGNNLEAIPQHGLPKLTNLKILSLSDNLITSIEDNAFLSHYSRTTLVKLDLSANNMTRLASQSFLGLESLRQLSLDKNGFVEIPSAALANLPTLEELSMGVNHIERVEANALPLPNLKSLSLEVNKIRRIDGEAFESVPHLTYLYLGNNLFTAIEPTMFYYIRHLKVLSMSNNKDITQIALDSFQFVPAVVRLELSDCSLTHIAPQSLHKMPKVQVLVLSRNQLTSITSPTFAALPELVSIDLGSNAINNIDDFSFSQLPSLSHLDLSSNRLESLPENFLYDSLLSAAPTKSRSLYLQNNPWRCDDNMSSLRKWLRENGDVQTSPPGSSNAKCWTPANLSGLDIRQTDPVRSGTARNGAIGDPMRKYIQTTPASYGVPLDINSINSIPEDEPPHISQTNVIMIGIAVVAGLIAMALILVALVQCAKPAEKKDRPRNSGSPSMDSAFSTTLSGSAMFQDQFRQRSATNANVFLNRPRYWWF